MVASIEQIQRDLATLRTKASHLATQFADAYQTYLQVLGKSVQKQMVLACFSLCTERHAREFLSLTLTQRQTLQQDLQKLGVELQRSLLALVGPDHYFQSNPSIDPPDLFETVIGLESSIVEALRTTSFQINKLLEQNKILHIKSLDALFEIAAKAEEAGRSITNPPLLLKAIVDIKEEDEKNHPLTAIYLQLGDLEFADPNLQGARHGIRQLRQQLDRLDHAFDQKIDEADVAEAIAAWRASWFVYEPQR